MTKLVRWEENPDEIVLEEVEMFHLESMNERSLWVGIYTQDKKIYHLNIHADGDRLRYYWSDETCDP
jgi:tagatose-1,6-bisphosphate aldolase non-catalytic subunit AgaZ/GatZ